MYTKKQFAKMIDNTLLRPDSTRDDILRFCDESEKRHFASVCVFPCWVGTAVRRLSSSDVKVCTAIAFPFGATTRMAKVFEIKNSIANGAKEVDCVMNISKFKSGDHTAVAQDLEEMVEATRSSSAIEDSRRTLIKIIIEVGLLTDDEKGIASRMVRDAGADFIKTCTGTIPGGVTMDDVRHIRRSIGPSPIGIKAAGGIRTVQAALQMLDAGANRIGTSQGIALFDGYTGADDE
jgi:deoxyribose-phosphate aldolase